MPATRQPQTIDQLRAAARRERMQDITTELEALRLIHERLWSIEEHAAAVRNYTGWLLAIFATLAVLGLIFGLVN